MLIGGIFTRNPCILIGNDNIGAGNGSPGSVLNRALKPTADALSESGRSKEKQAHKTNQQQLTEEYGWRPESAETLEPVRLRLHTASLRHCLKPDSEWRISQNVSAFIDYAFALHPGFL
jgi:hypothetical protein